MTALRFTDVGFGYGREDLFSGFSLAVEAGEFFGVVGPNGAGKSTLLRLAAGLLAPQTGSVHLNGRNLCGVARREVARLCGVVLQEGFFALDYRVEDVVMMGRNAHLGRFEQPGTHDRRLVADALEFVGATRLQGKSINDISAGEKQRVILARALVQEPEVFLLDEATSHLDISHQRLVVDVLRRLNRQGRTILFLSHDLNLAALVCSRMLLLDRGRTVVCDVPERVVTRELIEQVYGVKPILMKHPDNGRPQIMLPT